MGTTADIKNGSIILHRNSRMKVVEFQHVKPGKGPAFVRTKLKDIKNIFFSKNFFLYNIIFPCDSKAVSTITKIN